MADTPQYTPMFGVWNEHWKNHPAGLPVSQYKPNTNPNRGASSVVAPNDWFAWYQSQGQPSAPATGGGATPGGSTGGGTTTPTTPTTPSTPNPSAGMSNLTGFASRYTPAMLQQAYENPWYILRDVFSGVSESSPLYQALRDMGGDPLTLFNISQGSQQELGGDGEDFVNWLANVYQQQGTVGGTDFNVPQMLQAIFGQDKFGADAQNTLGQILGAGDMSTQIRTLYNMARDVTNVGMNPLAARGYQAALAQAGDRYGQEMLKTPGGSEGPQNPAAWIAERMPWLAAR
jgi:hypothetical protein